MVEQSSEVPPQLLRIIGDHALLSVSGKVIGMYAGESVGSVKLISVTPAGVVVEHEGTQIFLRAPGESLSAD